MKRCPRCGIEKATTEFHRHAGRFDGLQPYCKPCKLEQKHTDSYRASARRSRLKRKYGVPVEYVDNATCSICGALPPLVVDHDHSCCPGEETCGRCVRGPLCQRCNNRLGHVGEDVAWMAAAIEYLTNVSLSG